MNLRIVTLSLALLPVTVPVFAADYSITDLGTLGGTESAAYGINASGTVVGRAYTNGDVVSGPALFLGHLVTDLGGLAGTVDLANAINVDGVVVGTSIQSGTSNTLGFVALGKAVVSLGTLGGTSSTAAGINASGQITGDSQIVGDLATHAYRYQGGGMQDLGTLGGGSSFGYGINASGHVVGKSVFITTQAFLVTGNSMTGLGVLGTGDESAAYAINDNEQIVGASNLVAHGALQPFLYQNGRMQDLGTLGGDAGTAYAINLSTQIVGEAQTTNNAASHAFLYQGGQMIDLNSLLPENSGWELTVARAINDSGQIAGTGTISGQAHAFLLSPILPTNPSSSGERPRVYINGARRIQTDKPRVQVEGSVGGPVAGVKYRVGNRSYSKATGGTNGWHFKVHVNPGPNRIQVVAYDASGRTSLVEKMIIVRTSR